MAKQLIFCSAPHGLQPGRSGYCLVAGHTDLPQSLIRQLEQETSVFPDTNDSLPPFHQIRKSGETEWHLFTCQTTNLRDYTGRQSGLTHVIAERVDQLPATVKPETVLQSFTDWVTTTPEIPRVYGKDEEIDLIIYSRQKLWARPVETAIREEVPIVDKVDGFRLNTANQKHQPAPRPRSGIYYERRPRKSTKGWWIGLGLILVLVVVIIAL